MIKAVSFDLWFTLIWETREDEELYLRMRLDSLRDSLREEGHDLPLDTLREAYSATKDFRMVVPPRDLLRMIFARMGLNEVPLDRALQAYVSSTDSFIPKVNEEALSVIPELKQRGVKLALVTNTSFSERSIRAILKNVGLDLFDLIITSCETGLIKPQKGIFSMLVDKMGIKESQIAHVGDSCYHDVIGASLAGLRAIHYPKLSGLRGFKEDCMGFERIDSLYQLLELI